MRAATIAAAPEEILHAPAFPAVRVLPAVGGGLHRCHARPRPARAAAALEALIAGPQNQADYRPGWRLAAYVQSLEYDGWRIRSRLFKHPRCACPIAEYTLDRQDPATAAALDKRKQAGFIAPELLGLLALAVVAGLLLVGGAL